MKNLVAIATALTALLATTGEVLAVQLDVRPALRKDDAELSRGRGRYVIAAAGDIACEEDPNGRDDPETCQYDDTANLIRGTGLTEVLTLGDNQYEIGSHAAFMDYFDQTWGRAFANLSPVPGNHDYAEDPTSRARGYFRYFGHGVKGPHGLGYYSYDLGACPQAPCWHLIALNSVLCFAPGGCGAAADPDDPGPGNRMYRWLRRDLVRHPDTEYPCTLAYWHHPLFSFSTVSGASTSVRPLWDLLYAARADVVLNGHSHNYQRWRPRQPNGVRDNDHGIRQFVVGTGGRHLYAIPGGEWPTNLVVAQADSFGVLKIALKAEGYRWEWATAAGQPTFTDAPDRGVKCVRDAP